MSVPPRCPARACAVALDRTRRPRIRFGLTLTAVLCTTVLGGAPVARAGGVPTGTAGASITGKTVYFEPAGLEKNFDLVVRVGIALNIRPNTLPPFTIVTYSYLENFQADTKPKLPDLTDPKRLL